MILNIGSEPVNLQNWIHRRTDLIQTTLDGAVQKWFSVLLNQIGSDSHKIFQKNSTPKETNNTREFYIMKCGIPNETNKKLVVRIETLVRKAYSLNTHDYKHTK